MQRIVVRAQIIDARHNLQWLLLYHCRISILMFLAPLAEVTP